MRKLVCALLALALCLPIALAEEEGPREAPPAPPAAEEISEPEPAPVPEPEPVPAPEPEPEPEPVPEPEIEPEPAPEEPEGEPGAAEEPDGPATMVGPGVEGPALPVAPQAKAESAPEGYLEGHGEAPAALKELLAEGGEKTVYVLAREPVTIPDFRLELLRGVTLLPAPEAFPGGEFVVTLRNGDSALTEDDVRGAGADAIVELVIAVEARSVAPPAPGPVAPPEPGEEPTLRVEVLNATPTEIEYAPDEDVWRSYVEFHLSGIPEGSEDYVYVALVYDERFIPLSGPEYIPLEEGEYTLRFAIWNAQGDVVSASDAYALKLDNTPPVLAVEVSATQDYTMTLSGFDARSGVRELSLDGGATWSRVELDEGLSVVHTEARRKVFPPETIRIRDAAGNESWNLEEVVLDRVPRMEPMDFGGYGGGGSPSATAAPHASGDGDDAPYDAYELALPEGPVEALTLGGEAIDLGLARDGAPGRFTAELAAWAAEGAADAEPAKDTLVIRAEGGAPGEYAWRVNGSVLRKLYNSEIAYLALGAGGALLALPTVGFTAGTRYAELKMAGVSTAEFTYEIVMRVGPGENIDPGMLVDPETGASAAQAWNVSPDCSVAFAVEVAGERYEMIGRAATPQMYPFDVYCGPEDLMDYPYGAYPGTEAED